ncbi:MAG: aldehyde dehydrogenase family protein [Rhodobacteraceae bacterium]|nr:aldehyde dehydrogenase family protein [Paracoccaceae bacterium]
MPSVREALALLDYGPSPESAADVRAWLDAHAAGFGHFIDGAFSPPGATFETRAPATGEILARVAEGTPGDVARAVAAARRALPAWSGLAGHDRARHLYALARHVQKRARFLAVLESLDNGKPIRESRDIDVPLVARHFYHHAGWAEVLAEEFPGQAPVGVCGQVIPWNFPLLMLAWKVAPALAAGCTVVLKPAEYTPLSALAFAMIAAEAGLPRGVLNVVTGGGATGAALVAAGVDKVAFTGSTAVGRAIRRATAGTGKALTLELGGKSPFVVMDDADLDAAVEGVVDAIWFNQGQVCCAGARILVQEGVARPFAARLARRMARLRLGDPLDKSTDIGAIVHPVQLARIVALVRQGEAEGAELHQAACPLPERGSWFAPAFLTGVAPASVLAEEEIFGPVATLTPFRTADEAVELANATRYGLAASVWSENVTVALDLAARIRAGVVWVNATNVFDAGAPFGGWRESGFGREGGRAGMRAYLRPAPAGRPGREEAALPPPAAFPGGEAGADAGIDRTAKLYIGGRQVRPDGGNSWGVSGRGGRLAGHAALGNRKDLRNAVEAAHAASAWAGASGHGRAQVLYYLAENLAARTDLFARGLAALGASRVAAAGEVAAAVRRAFWYAAMADKFDGATHATLSGHVTLTMPEPWGVMGIACPSEAPLLALLSLVLPAIALGNRVVAIPSQTGALVAADIYQLLEASDVPAGVVNLVTGHREELSRTLAGHDDVAALWYFGPPAGAAMVEAESAGNLKATWVATRRRDWTGPAGQGRAFLDAASAPKTIWVPYGA